MSGNTKRRNYRKREVTPEETAVVDVSPSETGDDSIAQAGKDTEPEGLTYGTV